MTGRVESRRRARFARCIAALATLLLATPSALAGQTVASTDGVAEPTLPAEPTFSKDVAPILYENCVRCHRDGGVAPMPLVGYDDARRFAPLIAYRTGLYPGAGTMPPYYLERGVGIQEYKDDERLDAAEIATLAAWAEAGAPEGDPADLPPAPDLASTDGWTIEPDVVVRTEEIFMEGGAPDWWGEISPVEIPLEEDRYVKSVEIREVNDVPSAGTGRSTVGGRFIVHHMIWRTAAEDDEGERVATGWPVHELGRNPDQFDPDAGRLLRAGSRVESESVHLHSNGRDTRARLEIGFELHPEDYEPTYERLRLGLGDGQNIDIGAGENGQELHAYAVLPDHTKIISFEPHLHAPGERMCLEYIWGTHRETLTCSGYDHNWVKQYTYDDGHQPLIPRGAILHITAWMNNTESNPNVPDPRNWQGAGNRSVGNMFIDLGSRVRLTDEQFVAEMAERRRTMNLTKNDQVIGCPLCLATIATPSPKPADERPSTTAGGDDDD